MTRAPVHSGTEPRRSRRRPPAIIPIDASVDLAYDKPVAQLGPGELFGEMTCLIFYPRSATVRAVEDDRRPRDAAQRAADPAAEQDVPAELERALSRARARHAPAQRPDPGRPHRRVHRPTCATASSWSATSPGEVICRQGDAGRQLLSDPDRLREGDARRSPAASWSLPYLARGNYFGEIGLLGGGVRTATCTALDHVEVVRISGRRLPTHARALPRRSAARLGGRGPSAAREENAAAGLTARRRRRSRTSSARG